MRQVQPLLEPVTMVHLPRVSVLLLTARCRAGDGREWVPACLGTAGIGHASGQVRRDEAGQGA